MPGDPHVVFTVSELTRQIKGLLDEVFPLVWVEGEISNFHRHSSGHLYFCLKDAGSQVNVVMFRTHAQRLRFQPEDGQTVLVRGAVGVYERRGEYQLNANAMEVRGLGAQQLALEALRRKLEAEGLFDPARKKPLPAYPERIGVITSPTGAAVRDVLQVLGRRFCEARVWIYPVRVQGEGAAGEIVRALGDFNAQAAFRPDVVILGRGGGSAEDLSAFNDEALVRAVAGSRVPVISAVGHETDWTLCDFVSDFRCPTPSAAAQRAVPSREETLQRVRAPLQRAVSLMALRLQQDGARLERCRTHYAFREPAARIRELELRADEMTETLRHRMQTRLEASRSAFGTLAQKLAVLNPLGVLGRGYSITRDLASGRILADAARAPAGTLIETRLARGTLVSRVEDPGNAPAGPGA